jgi:uncharacterized membrane protein YcaP (DUF421 family)
VRLGSKRFLGQTSAFDTIVGIMLGSIMSRAINSSAPFFPTLIAGVVLVGHACLAHRLRTLVWQAQMKVTDVVLCPAARSDS